MNAKLKETLARANAAHKQQAEEYAEVKAKAEYDALVAEEKAKKLADAALAKESEQTAKAGPLPVPEPIPEVVPLPVQPKPQPGEANPIKRRR